MKTNTKEFNAHVCRNPFSNIPVLVLNNKDGSTWPVIIPIKQEIMEKLLRIGVIEEGVS